MAYFANSTEGSVFEYQCSLCKYGDKACPIFFVQFEFNYDACNNEVARKILDHLVENNGGCAMFKEFKKDFAIQADKNAPSLFDVCFPELSAKEHEH